MKIKDIIKEKYKVARKYYETYKHTTECSYYMGYLDALGELLERIEQEEEKKIPEKFNIYDDSINWCCNGRAITDTEKDIMDKINEILDYFKNKGDE